jgi:hypothetical protein
MATRYAVLSGAWSETATWSATDGGLGGATVPADNDVVVISAGVSVLMDVDQSAFVTGIAGVTIRGAAVTPGMLYFKDGTNGYLKIKASTTIVGTNTAVFGRILANSDGVWGNTGELTAANSATIYLLTSAYINAQYLSSRFYCHQPTTKYVEVYTTLTTCTHVAGTNNFTTSPTLHGLVSSSTVKFKVVGGGVLPSPLVVGYMYVVTVINTTSFSLRYYSGGLAIPITDSGSGTFQVYNGSLITSGATMNVMPDVSLDDDWTDAVYKSRVYLSNSLSNDLQSLTISSKASGTVTLSAAPNSDQQAGSLLFLTYRNVRIVNNSTVANTILINHGATSAIDCEYGCEITSIASTALPIKGNNLNFSGIAWRTSYTLSQCVDVVMSGITLSGCAQACTGLSVTGMIAGVSLSMLQCSDSTFSGTNCGCLRLFSESNRCNVVNTTLIGVGNGSNSGGVFDLCNGGAITNCQLNYCTSASQTSNGIIVSSSILTGCYNTSLHNGSIYIDNTVSIIGSLYVFYGGAGICNASMANCRILAIRAKAIFNSVTPNTIGIGISYSEVLFRNSTLSPAIPVSSYFLGSNNHNNGVLSLDDGGIPNQLCGWNSGGLITTEAYSSGTHGTPPVALSLVYKFTYQAAYSNGIDIPLVGRRNVPTRIKVYIKKDTNSMTKTPYVKLCDPNYGFEDVGEQLAIATMTDDTNWQTLVVEYTPTYDKPIVLRIAGANASGTTYWNWEQCSSSSWGNTMLGG